MGREVFDQFPLMQRLFGLVLCAGIAGMLASSVPDHRGWAAIPIAVGVILLFTQNVFAIDLDRRTWSYRRGVWPILVVSAGDVGQLYGISIGVSRFERSSTSEYKSGSTSM